MLPPFLMHNVATGLLVLFCQLAGLINQGLGPPGDTCHSSPGPRDDRFSCLDSALVALLPAVCLLRVVWGLMLSMLCASTMCSTLLPSRWWLWRLWLVVVGCVRESSGPLKKSSWAHHISRDRAHTPPAWRGRAARAGMRQRSVGGDRGLNGGRRRMRAKEARAASSHNDYNVI
jgi:hypothetical protein